MLAEKIVDEALSYLKVGEFAQAQSLCMDVLKTEPTQVHALHCLGLIALQTGAYQSAAVYFERVLDFEKQPPALLYCQLAYAMRCLGRDREALIYYDKALILDKNTAEIYDNHALILNRLGDKQGAIQSYKRAIELAPEKPDFYYNLGNALMDMGQSVLAAENYRKAIAIIDQNPHAGTPTLYAILHNSLGRFFYDIYDYQQTIRCLKKAIESDPELWNPYYNFANMLWKQGDTEEALVYYRKALGLNPASAEIRWGYALAHLPVFFTKAEDVELARARFSNELDALGHWFETERNFKDGGAVGDVLIFPLAYQDKNNRDLMIKYGKLCSRIMAAWKVQQAWAPLAFSNSFPRRRLKMRVGIVSSHFWDHSVWRALIKGWLKHFDMARMETHIFQCGFHTDEETHWVKRNVTSFIAVGNDLHHAVQIILAQQCDVLIYPAIGMDTLTLKLASLRLCPMQAASWGHPETTGLPTIDYYLSAEDFEPPDADAHYSEKLIRLPGLGCCYEPLDIKSERQDLGKLGIRTGVPLLLSPGLSLKYAPQNDHIFCEIARRLGACQIIFFKGPDGLGGKLEARIRNAFEQEHLDFAESCVFLSWQTRSAFYGLMEQATVFLDTIGFSGFNTALQAIQCGLPIVTREGHFMRGRFGSAILKRLDLHELVQYSNEGYIDLAVKLVQDSNYRQKIGQQIRDRRDSLWGDRLPVSTLQNFLMTFTNSQNQSPQV